MIEETKVRVQAAFDRALELGVIGDADAVRLWMYSPNSVFGDSPFEKILLGHDDDVLDYLYHLSCDGS